MLDLGVVDNGVKVPSEVRIFCTECGIEGSFHGKDEDSGDVNVSESDALANEEGACAKIPIQLGESLFLAFAEV